MTDDPALTRVVREVLNQWATAGMAVAVVRDGVPRWFHGHGFADVATGSPVGPDTIFRIASITKTMTAIAVLQLWERRILDLDAPAGEYLRSYALVPASPDFRLATLRDLLTHTAGVRAVRTPADFARPALGWGAPAGHRLPTLGEYYRGGLRLGFEPGSRWAYSNHGFATLGQIVTDVTGIPLDRYLRDEVFRPLGMADTGFVSGESQSARLARGYELHSDGLRPARDLEPITVGASSVYSTADDMARYMAALLKGGANEHGRVLGARTLTTMFAPHYQPDPRLPGTGLGFLRNEVGGHRTVGHDGIWKGFLSAMVLAPDDGIGVLALANTGNFEPRGAPGAVVDALLRLLLDVREDSAPVDIPARPWVWRDLCGWYSFGPGMLTDPQPRMVFGAGVEVVVRSGHLVIRGQTPIPAVRRGLPLLPDATDPDVFHLPLKALGLDSTRVVFSRGPDGAVAALHLGLTPMTFRRRPDVRNPRPWLEGGLAVGTTAAVLGGRVYRSRRWRTGRTG